MVSLSSFYPPHVSFPTCIGGEDSLSSNHFHGSIFGHEVQSWSPHLSMDIDALPLMFQSLAGNLSPSCGPNLTTLPRSMALPTGIFSSSLLVYFLPPVNSNERILQEKRDPNRMWTTVSRFCSSTGVHCTERTPEHMVERGFLWPTVGLSQSGQEARPALH